VARQRAEALRQEAAHQEAWEKRRAEAARREEEERLQAEAVLQAASSGSVDLRDFTVFRDAAFAPELVVMPAEGFNMGSADQRPQHPVTISRRFAIGRYPVIFDEYDRFCEASGRETPGDAGWGRGRRPVINVSWHDAEDYVAWLSQQTGQDYRLPSEAEWEYACRAGTTSRYSFGNTIEPDTVNFSDSRLNRTNEIDAYPANRWGLHDMHGNVWEWVEDDWHESYRGAPTDGSAWKETQAGQKLHFCVLRGGSWVNGPWFCGSAFRNRSDSGFRSSHIGFRVARTLS
jgi:formylglycine-generating enzyme required for sulfatase activity